MSFKTDTYQRPTFGNWRRPMRAGYKNFSGLATVLMFAGLVVSVVAAMVSLVAGLATAAITGIVLFLFTVKDKHGKTRVDKAAEWVGYRKASVARTRVYQSQVIAGRARRLPGVAAPIQPVTVTSHSGEPVMLLRNRAARLKTWTLVLKLSPDGGSLVDPQDADTQVARWAQFLSLLGDEDGLVAAQVVIEAAPDTGNRLRQAVLADLDPDAPELVRQIMMDASQAVTTGLHRMHAWLTMTFTPQGKIASKPEQFAQSLANRVNTFISRLAGTGASDVRVVTEAELAQDLRIAYDPAALDTIDAAGSAEQEQLAFTWAEAGPSAHQAGWDSYRHDSGLSRSWVMTDAPRGHIYSDRLAHLLAPHPDILRKRVALLFRPVPSGQTPEMVEADLNWTTIRVNGTTRPTARALAEKAHAEKAAAEEAAGAGLVNFSLIVTATVRPGSVDGDELERASIVVESTLAPSAKIRLRPAYGAQDATFAAGLPLGVSLPEQSAIPAYVREAM